MRASVFLTLVLLAYPATSSPLFPLSKETKLHLNLAAQDFSNLARAKMDLARMKGHAVAELALAAGTAVSDTAALAGSAVAGSAAVAGTAIAG
jgi:hypothetical protein